MLIFSNKYPVKDKKDQKKTPEMDQSENGKAKDRLSFLKVCARKEGITMSHKIWKQIEKIIETDAKW